MKKVDEEIEKMRERNARYISVEDRAAQDGDLAVIDFEGFVDGVAFEGGKGENYDLTLGSHQFIPGFEEQVVGHSAGEEFDINVTFPEEYAEELRILGVTLPKTEQIPMVRFDRAKELARRKIQPEDPQSV